MNKCKYCGSDNLILEPKGSNSALYANQVALKCGDCGKWLKWCPKEERASGRISAENVRGRENERDII